MDRDEEPEDAERSQTVYARSKVSTGSGVASSLESRKQKFASDNGNRMKRKMMFRYKMRLRHYFAGWTRRTALPFAAIRNY